MTPADLITALMKVPRGCTLEKNPVGNLSVIDGNRMFAGWVDLQTAELNMTSMLPTEGRVP